MELWASLGILVAGACLGAGAVLIGCRRQIASLQATLSSSQTDLQHRSHELAQACQEAESWRGQCQAEQLERSRFETEARRVEHLEADVSSARSRVEMLAAEKASVVAQANRIPGLERQVAALGEQVTSLTATNAQLQTQLQEQAQAQVQQVLLLTQIRGEIEKDLKNITADALHANQGAFLQLANEVFEKHKTGADVELEARKKAVGELIGPLQETLQSYRQQVEEMDRARSQSYGALSAELKAVAEAQNAVRSETSKLINALRAAPKTRGRWGEQTLRNVLELAGLSAHCDFSTEETFRRDGSLSRPDVVIRLPGGRTIVIDAKTSLSAYLDAVDAVEDIDRDRHLALHAAQIRTHMKQLSGKSYWDGLTVTPDFVVMFVPGDNFYVAAAERDPSLFEDAAAQRVIIVTPATLIALAKAIAFGWRQEKVAENAQAVHTLGRELYRRLITMTAHIEHCGDALNNSVKHFNQFIGSLESSVLPQARRFNELEVEGTTNELPILEQIEIAPRQLRPSRASAEADTATPTPPTI